MQVDKFIERKRKERDAADRLIVRWHGLIQSRNTIFLWEHQRRDKEKEIPFFPTKLSKLNDEERKVTLAIIEIMNFFEEWGSLAKVKGLDREYIHDILGMHAQWFCDHIFLPLNKQVLKKQVEESRNQLVAPLYICAEYVFKFQKKRPTMSIGQPSKQLKEITKELEEFKKEESEL